MKSIDSVLTREQARLTVLLRDANAKMGANAVRAILPKPFELFVNSHDTGCQPAIQLTGEGLPRVAVWKGSVWYSPAYEWNDRYGLIGLNEECAFAAPAVEKFFSDLGAHFLDWQVNQVARDVGSEITRSAERARVLERYREMLDADADREL